LGVPASAAAQEMSMIRQIDPNRLQTLGSDGGFLRRVALDAGLGALLGLVAASTILFLDLGGLRSLIFESDMAIPAVALLYVSFTVTFAGAVCSTALMTAPDSDDDSHDDGEGIYMPIPVRVSPRRRIER
jgi:hypothetical protein